MSPKVVSIDSHEAKVVDMAVAPRDSHLLVVWAREVRDVAGIYLGFRV